MRPGAEGEALELRGQTVLILGCGAVGGAFASAFVELGADVLLWSRNAQRTKGIAEVLGAEVIRDLDAGLGRAVLVCLSIADDALQAFVPSLARGPAAEGFLFHTSGSAEHELLAPALELGWQTGKLHPLRAFPQESPRLTRSLSGTWFATQAGPEAALICSGLVLALGGHELRLSARKGASLAMHSAACLLSGGLVALFDQALEVAQAASEDAQAARSALGALLHSTVFNLDQGSPAEALSGPIARGAEALVARQLEVLTGDARALYRLLGKRMLELSHGRSPLEPKTLKTLVELLS